MSERGLYCRICGCELAPDRAVSCSKCKVPFHPECWDYNEGCGIYGCGAKTNEQYVLPQGGAVVSIDEESKPPFSVWPYVERLARSLPRWGRVHGTAALLGCAGPIMVVLSIWGLTVADSGLAAGLGFLAKVFKTIFWEPEAWAIFMVGPFSGLFCSLFSPYEENHGATVAGVGYGLAAALVFGRNIFKYVFGYAWASLFLGISVLFLAIVASSSAAGRLLPREWTKTRSVVTVFLLAVFFMTISFLKQGHPSGRDLEAIFILSTFGFAVTSPQLSFSKSALFHRLKAEEAEVETDD